MLGLPDGVTACLFDLDGVLTDTAAVHDAAWTRMFDDYLRARSQRTGEPFRPFDPDSDYMTYVDGRPRADGVRTFLESRGITLPEGGPDDGPDQETVHGLANRKNVELLATIARDGVKVFPDARRYLDAARGGGLTCVVVSSSANTRQVLEVTGLIPMVDGMIDGVTIRTEGLPGKPAPDTFLAGARCARVEPRAAAVFEDAVAGVAAGRAGRFGLVVGIDRVGHGHGDDLRENGADVVVTSLDDLASRDH